MSNDPSLAEIIGTAAGTVQACALTLWAIGREDRGKLAARLRKWVRPNTVRASYRAGIIEGRRLGRMIERTDYYNLQPDLETLGTRKDPVAAWLPAGREIDPLYWGAFEHALRPFVMKAWKKARREYAMSALFPAGGFKFAAEGKPVIRLSDYPYAPPFTGRSTDGIIRTDIVA